MFSSPEVSAYINETFEPIWESLRSVPTVTIDFGDGHVVKRTLQGNIATYVCSPDAIVYDVLPGIYPPAIYRKQLEGCRALATSVGERKGEARTQFLRAYHVRQAEALAIAPPTPQVGNFPAIGGNFKGGFGGVGVPNAAIPLGFQGSGGGFKGGVTSLATGGGIEGPTERLIMGWRPLPFTAPSVPLADRPELLLDAQVNEHIRRPKVHDHLAKRDGVMPDDIKKWLFKEVLYADLDDPYLGLKGVLTANYPFADEDSAIGFRE